jgi:hypothetical protein
MTPYPEGAPAAIATNGLALRARPFASTAAACAPPGDQATSRPTTTDEKWGQIRPSRWGQAKSSFSGLGSRGNHDAIPRLAEPAEHPLGSLPPVIASLTARHPSRQHERARLPSIAIVGRRLLRTHLRADCERAQEPRDR